MSASWVNVAYLVSAVLFILGLKGLTHPRTAVRGNLLGAAAMWIAVVATLFDRQILGMWWIVAGLALGTAIGAVLALKITIDAMPQMVALLNGFGGGASALVAAAAVVALGADPSTVGESTLQQAAATALSGLIGTVTLTGSLVAFVKFQEIFRHDTIRFGGQRSLNVALTAMCLAASAFQVWLPSSVAVYALIVLLAAVLGVSLVLPIGGADMPVVIALLNSLSGLAAASTGFVLANNVLVIAGSLVGASGFILTGIMCKAMNRTLAGVLFGSLGPDASGPSADEVYAGRVKATNADEIATLLDGARRVVIVPGYGMAVAQAQHAVRDLTQVLEQNGTEVEFGIHPVAGRMPGHMNVLLAEAEIPYEQLREMDEINPTFSQTDLALVIGANDVVNPEARTNPSSPIAGMPILDVDKARTVVVIKRSLSPGFAGIPNPLFAADNTLMYFADGKQAVLDLVAAVKSM